MYTNAVSQDTIENTGVFKNSIMRQSFKKTLQGHELEFNRLLFPLRYNVLIKSTDKEGQRLIVEKDGNGTWNISSRDHVPCWVWEISQDIHDTIVQNENLAAETLS